MSAESYRKLIEKKPWYVSWRNARRRCIDDRHKSWSRYGGRGIEFKLTREECEALWIRDRAWELDRPRLDRRDVDQHYTFENFRFITERENTMRMHEAKTIAGPIEWEE